MTSKGCVARVAIAPALAADSVCTPVDDKTEDDPVTFADHNSAFPLNLLV